MSHVNGGLREFMHDVIYKEYEIIGVVESAPNAIINDLKKYIDSFK